MIDPFVLNMDFIEKQRILFPDLAESYDAMGQLFTKKFVLFDFKSSYVYLRFNLFFRLWHELTVVLEEFLQNSRNYRGNNIYEVSRQSAFTVSTHQSSAACLI